MSEAICGTDSKGRPIGYEVGATCDHDGCEERIDRGLSHSCGEMHGEVDREYQLDTSCEGYFCFDHLVYQDLRNVDGKQYSVTVCFACYERERT